MPDDTAPNQSIDLTPDDDDGGTCAAPLPTADDLMSVAAATDSSSLAPTPAPSANPRLDRLRDAQPKNSTWLAFGVESTATQASLVDGLGEPIAFRRWGHPDWPRNVKHFGDAANLARNPKDHDFGGTTAMGGVTQIVLHETAGFGGCWPSYGVHFFVDEDGIIHQCADINAQLNHATNWDINLQSIGIELSNNPWADSPPADRQRLPKAKWVYDGNLNIVLPRQDQCEKLVWLVDMIMKTSGVTIPKNWRNIWPAPEDGQPASGFIALGNASTGAGLTATAKLPGVLCHAMVPHHTHSDGSFPAMYTWLRLSQGRPPEDAWSMASQRICSAPIANPPELDSAVTVLDAAFG